MATQVQLRRGTATENDAFTGAQGELTFDTTNKRVRIHDGATAGGFELKTENSSGDTLFADNEKAIFGAGSDLQIYHDGTHSYIKDAGTGNLRILGANIAISNAAGTENHIVCYDNGAVELSYDDVTKIATTSTGIDVTGTVTADGLTVDGNAKLSAGSPTLRFTETDQTDLHTRMTAGGGSIYIQTENDAETVRKDRFRIQHSTGDISFYEDTGTTAKFFWDASAESLGIGTSSPTSGGGLTLSSSTTAQGFIDFKHTVDGDSGFIGNAKALITGATTNQLGIRGGTSGIAFGVGATERMRIDNSGNVGIGCVPSSIQSGFDTLQIGGNLTLNVDSTGAGAGVYMGNNVYRDSNNSRWEYIYTDEATQYVQANGEHIWRYAASGTANNAIGWSEAMRIDSSGNLLVGTTDNTVYNNSGSGTGINLQNFGNIAVARDGNDCMVLNRLNSDGAIANFAKDGSTVGTIGVEGADLTIGNGDVGIGFVPDFDAIRPMNMSTNAIRDAAIDLGRYNDRFKDLYLSGGVYLGGTGSANYLDDYEEGTWTPTFKGDTTDPTITYSVQNGDYTKVGRIVHVRCHLEISGTASGGSGGLYIGGLPFTSVNDGYVAGTVSYIADWDANLAPTMCLVNPNTTKIPLYRSTSSDPRNSSVRVQVGALGTNTQIYLAVSYNI